MQPFDPPAPPLQGQHPGQTAAVLFVQGREDPINCPMFLGCGTPGMMTASYTHTFMVGSSRSGFHLRSAEWADSPSAESSRLSDMSIPRIGQVIFRQSLSSDIFWWWYTITSNLRDLNPYDLHNFPVPESALLDPQLRDLGKKYLEDIVHNSTMLVREQRQTGRTETQS